MNYYKFKIEHTGHGSFILHSLESFSFLAKAKLISFSTKKGGLRALFLNTTTVIIELPDNENWNQLHDALFHQWHGFEFIEKIKAGTRLPSSAAPNSSLANECMGSKFVNEIYLTVLS